MPNETNDQSEGDSAGNSDQQKYGESQGVGGQVSAQGTSNSIPSSEAPKPEEEPVGSTRPEPRQVRKMSASDFKVRSEPKPVSNPPAPEPSSSPAVSPSTAVPEPAKAEPEPVPEPAYKPEPVHEPVYEPVHESEPVRNGSADGPYYMANDGPQMQEQQRQEKPKREPKKANTAGSGGFGDAVKGAFSFFTIFPIKVGEKEIQAVNKNFYVAPVVGLIIGIIAAVIGIVFTELRVLAMAPIAVIATIYILSKFLHFDGLADFGDGMISSGDRDGCVRALKDTRIGAGGLGIALIVVLSIYAGLSGIWGGFAIAAVIVIMEVFAKNAMVAAAVFGEPGTGMASEQVRNSTINTLLLSTIISVVLAFAGYIIMGFAAVIVVHGMLNIKFFITATIIIAGAVAASILIGWLIAYLSNRKFGFVNGDVLGAANEISKVLILFIAYVVIMFYLMPHIGGHWVSPWW